MEIKKGMVNHPDKDKELLIPRVIIRDKGKLFFEKHIDTHDEEKHISKATCMIFDCLFDTQSDNYEVDGIELIQFSPNDLTLLFDGVGHIHLRGKEQIKGFVESINWLYEKYFKKELEA